MLAGQRRRRERAETLREREREREREYFNGKREKLNKIHAYIYCFGATVHSYKWLCIAVEKVKILLVAPLLQNGF